MQAEGGREGGMKEEEEEIRSHKNNYAGVDPVAMAFQRA